MGLSRSPVKQNKFEMLLNLQLATTFRKPSHLFTCRDSRVWGLQLVLNNFENPTENFDFFKKVH